MDGMCQNNSQVNPEKVKNWLQKTVAGTWEGSNPPDHFSSFMDCEECRLSQLINNAECLFELTDKYLHQHDFLDQYIPMVCINLGFSDSIKLWDTSLLENKVFSEDDFCFHLINDFSNMVYIQSEKYQRTIDLSKYGLRDFSGHIYYSCISGIIRISSQASHNHMSDTCIFKFPV